MVPTVNSRAADSAITIVRGSALSRACYRDILAILEHNWQNADPYFDDFVRVMRNCADDMLVRLSDGQIDGVLRTKVIRSCGSPLTMPRTFEELVGPYWSRRDWYSDTRVLVDLTKRDGASGVASSLIAASLRLFREPNMVTFSPEDRAALHSRFGGYPVGRIENGRPRHHSPNVVLMCYRGFSSDPPPRWSRPAA